jgi:hypothetical protein
MVGPRDLVQEQEHTKPIYSKFLSYGIIPLFVYKLPKGLWVLTLMAFPNSPQALEVFSTLKVNNPFQGVVIPIFNAGG